MDITLKTGEWWAVPWWGQDRYYEDSQFNREEVENAFKMLREIFDSIWLLTQKDRTISEAKQWLGRNQDKVKTDACLSYLKERLEGTSESSEAYKVCMMIGFRSQHPLFDQFFGEGHLPFYHLAMLGRALLDVRNAKLLGDLRRRLRNAREYPGAHFELEMLAHLIRQECSIKRHPPTGTGNSKADLYIKKGPEELFIELKRLEPSKTNKEMISISNQIFRAILFDPFISSAPLAIRRLELSEELRAKSKTNDGLRDLLHSWPIIVQQIQEHIAEKARNSEWGHHIVPGLAKYEINPRQEGIGGQGSIGGLPLSQEAEVEKIFQNAVEETCKQLPKDKPGILIVHTPLPVDSNKVERTLLHSFSDRCHLSAIILIYTRFSIEGVRYDLDFIRNPDAIDVSNYATVRAIVDLGNL